MKLSPILTITLCLGLLSFFTARSSLAAEIININYKYRIAFADLTENDVKTGDLVTVTTPEGAKVALKVVETYPVMVKLTAGDDEGSLTDEQFAAIPVGSQVVPGGKPVSVSRNSRGPAKSPKGTEPGADDTPTHVERYSPGGNSGATKDPSVETTKVDKGPSARNVMDPVSAGTFVPAAVAAGDSRCSQLEERLDQMMVNNVKLTENITQILSEKNAIEARAKDKESEAAAARAKVEEIAATNASLIARIKNLETAVSNAEQEKTVKQKEIDSLNLKLGELKKKLAKMVEIINNNIKTYEK